MMRVMWFLLLVLGAVAFAGAAYFICAASGLGDVLLGIGLGYVCYELWALAVVLPPSKLPPDIRDI